MAGWPTAMRWGREGLPSEEADCFVAPPSAAHPRNDAEGNQGFDSAWPDDILFRHEIVDLSRMGGDCGEKFPLDQK